MILNCLNCCKSISSTLDKCPYCMIDVAGMVKAVEVKPIPTPVPGRLQMIIKRHKEKPLTKKVPALSIPNMAHLMRAAR